MSFVEQIIAIGILVFLVPLSVYLISRVISAAYFQSKINFFERMSGISPPQNRNTQNEL